MLGRGVGSVRQGTSPDAEGLVAEASPIHHAQHHRFARAEEDDTKCLERVIDTPHWLNPPAAQGVILGWRYVACKGREVERRHGFTHTRDFPQSHREQREKQQGD